MLFGTVSRFIEAGNPPLSTKGCCSPQKDVECGGVVAV